MNKTKMLQKITRRVNSIESRDLENSRLFFDHSTGNMMQFGFDVYGQGFTQSWSRNGYDIETKLDSFRNF